ncbi:MAG: TlpA family protein disulfide reductase [Acidimicrobiia bacterium]
MTAATTRRRSVGGVSHVGEAAGRPEGTAGMEERPARTGRRRRHPVRWTVLTVGVVFIVGWAIVAGQRLGQDPTVVRSPLLGKPAPTFTLPSLEGGEVSDADYAGRLYVVNFWASWCVPCRDEAPHLQAFYERWSPEGIGMIGIVYNDTEGKARGFRDEFGLTFPQAMDPGGRTAVDFGVFGIPETYVVDRRGVIMAKLIGAVGPTTLDEVVGQVLAGDTFTSRNDQYRTEPE